MSKAVDGKTGIKPTYQVIKYAGNYHLRKAYPIKQVCL